VRHWDSGSWLLRILSDAAAPGGSPQDLAPQTPARCPSAHLEEGEHAPEPAPHARYDVEQKVAAGRGGRIRIQLGALDAHDVLSRDRHACGGVRCGRGPNEAVAPNDRVGELELIADACDDEQPDIVLGL
jgi:hypothetical protein